MIAVVGDGRSGDPLHERDDKRDVYEGEVAKVDLGLGPRSAGRWSRRRLNLSLI